MSLSTSSGEWLQPSVAATRALRSARTRNQPQTGLTIKERSFAAMLVLRMDSRELGSVEVQVMASRKWRVSRTVAERRFRYVSNGSAENRRLQAVMARISTDPRAPCVQLDAQRTL